LDEKGGKIICKAKPVSNQKQVKLLVVLTQRSNSVAASIPKKKSKEQLILNG
jgi:hypothetical protein